jgi:hypothetical protein
MIDHEEIYRSEAEQTIGFLFGEPWSGWVRKRKSTVVPECTGIWWRGIYGLAGFQTVRARTSSTPSCLRIRLCRNWLPAVVSEVPSLIG